MAAINTHILYYIVLQHHSWLHRVHIETWLICLQNFQTKIYNVSRCIRTELHWWPWDLYVKVRLRTWETFPFYCKSHPLLEQLSQSRQGTDRTCTIMQQEKPDYVLNKLSAVKWIRIWLWLRVLCHFDCESHEQLPKTPRDFLYIVISN